MITVLPGSCWEIACRDDQESPHFRTEADARADADDASAVRQFDRPCAVAECNDCGREPEDFDNGSTIHAADPVTAADTAREDDMVVVGADVWCGDCRTNPHQPIPDPDNPHACIRCGEYVEEHPLQSAEEIR